MINKLFRDYRLIFSLIRTMMSISVLLFMLSLTNVSAVPSYLDPIVAGAPSQTNTLSGSGGAAGLSVWYWYDVNSGYDYFAYQLLNNGDYDFSPDIAYLSIGYSVAKTYTVTGSAGSSIGGDSWSPSTWGTSPANVSWSAVGNAAPIFPGNTSTTNPYFEFAVLHTGNNQYGSVSADIIDTGTSGHGNTIGPAIPEPGTLMLLGTGLSLFAGYRARKDRDCFLYRRSQARR